MKGAIVTGANGFIGSHVVTCLLQQGIPVAALCHDGKCDHLPQSDLLTVYPYDLLKQSEVVNTLPPPPRHLLRCILSFCMERDSWGIAGKYCAATAECGVDC